MGRPKPSNETVRQRVLDLINLRLDGAFLYADIRDYVKLSIAVKKGATFALRDGPSGSCLASAFCNQIWK